MTFGLSFKSCTKKCALKSEEKMIRKLLKDMVGAVLIIGMPIYGSWIYYFITGQVLDFGG